MDRKARCFVCQSKSESADETKTRKINNRYTNLDSSTWRTFCHYFYPPPLIGLLDSSSSLNSPAPENEDFSPPVFCEVCYQTILNLCNLHNQLELIQSQISKIVAQVSLAFVQEEEDNHDNNDNEARNKCNRQRKNKKEQQQQSDDDVIYSMRRRIRQRYQPSVCITKANLDIPSQQGGGGSTFSNGTELDEQFSPLSIHSNDLDLDSDFDVDFSRPIKQEVEDFINEPVYNEEYLNGQENITKNPDLPAEEKDSEEKLKKPRSKRKIKPTSISSSEGDEEDGSHGDQNQDSKSDSDYEPDHDSDSKLVVKKIASMSKAKIKTKTKSRRQVKVKSKSSDEKKVAFQSKSKNSPRAPYPYKRNKDLKKPTDDKLRRGQRTRRIDDDTFIYDDIYKVKRVTEPNGIFLKCETCGVLKKSTVHMKAHLREIHIESKKFICEICGFSCPTVWRIKTHMESHEEVGKYVCDECGKIFKAQRLLKRHQECHADQPFKCSCNRTFVYKSSLRKHMKTANHPEAGPAPEIVPFAPKICGVCKKDFVKEETFQKHMATFHGVKTPCDWCGGLFMRPQQHKRLNCKERFKHQNSGQNNVNDVFSDVEEDSEKEGQHNGEKDPFFES